MSDGDTVMKVDELGDTGVCAAERWPAGELELGTEIQYVEQTEHVVLFACLLPSHRYHAQLIIVQYMAPGSPRSMQ